MYRPNKKNITTFPNDLDMYEGESIETKVARLLETGEPIKDGAPIVYTLKKDGVRPEFDIRTDKWDIAQKAMDNVNASKIAKSKSYLTHPSEVKEDKTDIQNNTKND